MALTKIHAYPSGDISDVIGLTGILTGLAISSASFTPSATKITHEDGDNYRAATLYVNPGWKASIEGSVLKASGWFGGLDGLAVGEYLLTEQLACMDTGDRFKHGADSFVLDEADAPVWAIDDISRKDTKGDVGTVTINFDLIDAGPQPDL